MQRINYLFLFALIFYVIAAVSIGTGSKMNDEASKLKIPEPVHKERKEVLKDQGIFEATAYSYGCGTGNGKTCTMHKVDRGIIAVDPDVIPLGSKLWVEDYGYGIALDVGGAIKGRRIDVWLPSRDEAMDWGRKKVKVKIVEMK